MKIVELEQSQYRGFQIQDKYNTKFIRMIQIKKSKHIQMHIKKKRIFRKKERQLIFSLFEGSPTSTQAFGIFERKNMVACVQGDYDEKKNIYKIHFIYVNKRYRKEGFATELYQQVEAFAKANEARAIFVKVRSYNDPAISFFEKQGLHFVGLNTMAYTNDDIQNGEVRLEMGKRL